MKYRGIIFRGDEIRSAREGRKTQTRMLLKCDDAANADDVFFEERGGFWFPVVEVGDGVFHATGEPIRCPYGVPGDELWVRETWGPCAGGVVYRSDDSGATVACPDGGRWKPSIFMPRWASRLTLVVRSVRVERLSAITDEDALAEGVRELPLQHGQAGAWWQIGDGPPARTPRGAYIAAFRQMHKLPADADPWLWVVTFGVKP